MQRRIELDQRTIEYTLKRYRRSRHVRLRINAEGHLAITAPPHLNQRFLESVIVQKSRWILDTLARLEQQPRPSAIANDPHGYSEHKTAALTLIKDRLDHFNLVYRFTFRNITIRNQATRWGSCSRRGNLSFNYRIYKLPSHLADYIIVHELCHLGEFNHSPRFWNLVATTIPNYRELRHELKIYRLR